MPGLLVVTCSALNWRKIAFGFAFDRIQEHNLIAAYIHGKLNRSETRDIKIGFLLIPADLYPG